MQSLRSRSTFCDPPGDLQRGKPSLMQQSLQRHRIPSGGLHFSFGGAVKMKRQTSTALRRAALFVLATTLIVGCGKKDDSITQAEKKDAAKGVTAPSIAEVKAIAEEGFIYGLPIV